MAGKIDLGQAVRLPPRDAIAWFEAKGYRIGWNWWEVWQDAQARAFTVAKAARLDILEDIRAEVSRALAEGTTGREFVQALEPRLKARGWWGKQIIVDTAGNAEVAQLGSPWRLRNIYRTNVQTAYMAGRYKAQRENRDARPYWQYVAVMDRRTRPTHAAQHGKVFRADDPFWDSFYPPNGWGCRCRVRALSGRRLKALGLQVESSAGRLRQTTLEAGIDKRTGEVIQRPATRFRYTDPVSGQTEWFTPDAGWSYNPGEAARQGYMATLFTDRLEQADASVGAAAVSAAIRFLGDDLGRAYRDWMAGIDIARPRNERFVAGGLTTTILGNLREKGIEPLSAALTVRDVEVSHMLRDAKARATTRDGRPKALSEDDVRRLPEILASPKAVLFDTEDPALLYVFDAPDPRRDFGKVVVRVGFEEKVRIDGERRTVATNSVRSGGLVDKLNLDTDRYERWEGGW